MLLTKEEFIEIARSTTALHGYGGIYEAVKEAEGVKISDGYDSVAGKRMTWEQMFTHGAEWGIRKQEETFKLNGTPRVGKTAGPRHQDIDDADRVEFRRIMHKLEEIHTTATSANRRAELLELAGKLFVARLKKLDHDDLIYTGSNDPEEIEMIKKCRDQWATESASQASAILDAVDRACEVGK